jgi:hypothetical protein
MQDNRKKSSWKNVSVVKAQSYGLKSDKVSLPKNIKKQHHETLPLIKALETRTFKTSFKILCGFNVCQVLQRFSNPHPMTINHRLNNDEGVKQRFSFENYQKCS